MSEVVSRVRPQLGNTTADDLGKQTARNAGVASGDHLLAPLKNEGGLTSFTLSGGHTIEIADGCVNECMRILDVRHQQVAAPAADGYARHTGESRWAVTTAGLDCTNTVIHIAKALPSERPMLDLGDHYEGARESALRSALAKRFIAPAARC